MLVALASTAFAAELRLDLSLPEVDPVQITLSDVAVGSSLELPVRGRHARYRVTAEFVEPDAGTDWQLALTVRSASGRVLAQPTMAARTNQRAEFFTGQQVPVVAKVRHASGGTAQQVFWATSGVSIAWEVHETEL